MNKFFAALFFFSVPFIALAQDDLLDMLEQEDPQEEKINYAKAAFKTTRIINSHSIENVAGGVLDMKISHRFGFINGGAYELFGLDAATIRIGLDYGITDRLMIGWGRSSHQKMYDGFLKYKILRQSTGKRNMPVTLSWFSGTGINTLKWQDTSRVNYFTSRMYYAHQLIIGRKFSDNFSLQFMPTLVHKNIVDSIADENDIYSIGVGLRQKLTKRIAVNAEYYYMLPDQVTYDYQNSLSIGFDIETGGHVFQLHFTNSTAMVERGFITETTGKWFNGDIHFGFNVSRVFTIHQKKQKSPRE